MSRHHHGVRFVVASLAVHVLVVMLLAGGQEQQATSGRSIPLLSPRSTPRSTHVEPIEIEVELLAGAPASGGGPSGTSSARATTASRRARSNDAWEGLTIRTEASAGGLGRGRGSGGGTGNGIGFGNGGGVGLARDVPPPPIPVLAPPSRARPAKLIWPNRDRDVEDDADLFIARVTVDEDGDVVGARMVKTRPGSRGEHAANAIWQFRYLPALDDRGVPTRSTFEQPFQIR